MNLQVSYTFVYLFSALQLAEEESQHITFSTSSPRSLHTSSAALSPSPTSTPTPPTPTSIPPPPSVTTTSTKPSADTLTALSLLRAQPSFYAIVELKARPYHVHKNDVILTPKINSLQLGDVIALDRVREIGSPDFILKGNPYIDPTYFSIKAVVVEHLVSKENETLFKNRSGRNRIVKNKSHHTALRVAEIDINDKL
ncbi:hypothetical protein DFJ77DRAFT_473313 [Powellomyces hirtus]|nr:hypothetical protein DFJ77DRAFT_473313 [Powellomyces hirtus]